MKNTRLERFGRSKSTLFLMEQIIVIAVFAICAAVCVSLLTSAYLMTRNSVDTRNALMIAENAAESHKAFNGDIAQIANILGGNASAGSDNFRIYYDNNWQVADSSDASFVLNFEIISDNLVTFSDISVYSSSDSNPELLISLTAAARRGAL